MSSTQQSTILGLYIYQVFLFQRFRQRMKVMKNSGWCSAFFHVDNFLEIDQFYSVASCSEHVPYCITVTY